MNQTVWNILGFFTIIAIWIMLSGIPERLQALPLEQHHKFIFGITLFVFVLIVIVMLCFIPKSRPFTLRILGAIGVAGCIFSLVEGFQQRNFTQFPIIFLFWFPGSLYLVIKGKMSDEPPTQG